MELKNEQTNTNQIQITNSFVRTVFGAVGVTLANLDNAQISLNALLLQHPFSTKQELINRISKHYYMQLLREVMI